MPVYTVDTVAMDPLLLEAIRCTRTRVVTKSGSTKHLHLKCLVWSGIPSVKAPRSTHGLRTDAPRCSDTGSLSTTASRTTCMPRVAFVQPRITTSGRNLCHTKNHPGSGRIKLAPRQIVPWQPDAQRDWDLREIMLRPCGACCSKTNPTTMWWPQEP